MRTSGTKRASAGGTRTTRSSGGPAARGRTEVKHDGAVVQRTEDDGKVSPTEAEVQRVSWLGCQPLFLCCPGAERRPDLPDCGGAVCKYMNTY